MRSLDRLRQSYDEDAQVVVQDRKSPPRVLFSDTELLLEEVPIGTRVVFPNPPVEPLANARAAIRWAINHPEGCDPLHAQLRPGMKVVIALDDISLPLPPMRTPDVRQTILEIVLNLVPMDGGHKSVGTGLTDYLGLRAHHTPHAIRGSKSYMEPKHSALHGSVDRIGRVIDQQIDVFHIETCLNNRMYDGPLAFLGKREEDFTDLDRTALAALRWPLGKTPRALRQQYFHRVPAAYGPIAVAA